MKFTPTPELITLAECTLVAKAMLECIQPVVDAYESSILQRHQFQIAPKWAEFDFPEKVILDRKKTFLMSKEDFQIFLEESWLERDRAGLKVKHPENCPLLEAENLLLDAENALLLAVSELPGLDNLNPKFWPSLEMRNRAVELCLELLSPYCGKSNQILNRLAA